MGTTFSVTWTFRCDHLTCSAVIQFQNLDRAGACARGRLKGWTFSHKAHLPMQARCPDHAYIGISPGRRKGS